MNSHEQQLRQQLMEKDEKFARLAREHAGYDSILQELAARPHLTETEQIEEHRLKKLKLAIKDQMEQIISKHLQAV